MTLLTLKPTFSQRRVPEGVLQEHASHDSPKRWVMTPPPPGLGHLATSGTFLVISMGVGRCYSQGGLGVESGAAASPPFMHRTTAQQGRTPHKMSTVPKERNFGPK